MRVALLLLTAVMAAVVVGPALWTADPNAQFLFLKLAGPDLAAPLGRDELGRDLLARMLNGGRVSVSAGLAVLIGTTALGLLMGGGAALAGDRIDAVVSRMVDGLVGLPTLVIALAIVGVLGPSVPNLMLSLIAAGWPWHARVYRALVIRERSQEYVLAARVIGATRWRVALRHVWPNIAGPSVVLASASYGGALLSVTGLSFIGLGVGAPDAEWGAMISASLSHFQTEPRLVVVPGLATSVAVVGANLLGDALRDRLDPRGSDSAAR
jgi:peptide/nickel transport system permease protein